MMEEFTKIELERQLEQITSRIIRATATLRQQGANAVALVGELQGPIVTLQKHLNATLYHANCLKEELKNVYEKK